VDFKTDIRRELQHNRYGIMNLKVALRDLDQKPRYPSKPPPARLSGRQKRGAEYIAPLEAHKS